MGLLEDIRDLSLPLRAPVDGLLAQVARKQGARPNRDTYEARKGPDDGLDALEVVLPGEVVTDGSPADEPGTEAEGRPPEAAEGGDTAGDGADRPAGPKTAEKQGEAAGLRRQLERLRDKAQAESEAAERKIIYLEEIRSAILEDSRKVEKERDELGEQLERLRIKYDAVDRQRFDLMKTLQATGADCAPGLGTTPGTNTFEKSRLMLSKTQKENWGHGGDWLLSYSDFMTLLLCVFIVLFSLASSDEFRLKTVTTDIAKTFSGMKPSGLLTKNNAETGVRDLPGTETSMADTHELDTASSEIIVTGISRSPVIETSLKKPDELDTLREEIFRTFEDYALGESLLVSVKDKGVEITLRNGITFVEGGTDLLDSSREILDHLAAIISANRGFNVVVEGHTDDRPIRSSRYPSNWELSTARATGVVRYFTETKGLPEGRFTAAGYGEHRPVEDNSSGWGRAANRRVVIKLVSGNPG